MGRGLGWQGVVRTELAALQRAWPMGLAIWLWGGLLWRGAIALFMPLGLDEVYYFAYSHHLNWSYFDHPPLVALTTGLGWWLTGLLVPFTLRLGALLLYPLSVALLACTASRLYGQRVGLWTAAIVSVAPLLWITFGLLTAPDNALMLFWSLVLWGAAVEFLPDSTDPSRVYSPSWRVAALGLLVGLAGISKYHGFILGLGLVGFCATSRSRWGVFRSPWLLASLGLCLLALAPVVYWNSQHDWISFQFHLGLRFSGLPQEAQPYRLGALLVTWLLGVVYLSPTLGFPLWGYTARALWRQGWDWLRPPLSPKERFRHDREALILWLSAPIAIGMTLIGGQHHTFPAWPAPGFWGLSILLAAGMAQWRPRWRRRWLGGTALFIASLSLVALLHLTVGLLQKPSNYALLGGLIPVEEDGSTILLDTVQMRRQLRAQPALLQAIAGSRFVFTDEFYLAAYVAMALEPLSDRPVTTFSQDPRGFAFWFDPGDWIDTPGIFVTLQSFHRDTDPGSAFTPYFDSLTPLGAITLERGGVPAETLLFFQSSALRQPYPYPY